jgi:hypothetical protein
VSVKGNPAHNSFPSIPVRPRSCDLRDGMVQTCGELLKEK